MTTSLLFATLALLQTARGLTPREFSDQTGIQPGSYALVEPIDDSCVAGDLKIGASDDGAVSLWIGADVLIENLGAESAGRGGVEPGSAWSDHLEPDETHLITRIVATSRGFNWDQRGADFHLICRYKRTR